MKSANSQQCQTNHARIIRLRRFHTWARQGSNLQGLLQRILSPSRLPIPPRALTDLGRKTGIVAATEMSQTTDKLQSHALKFTKVRDGRKQDIRGPWVRNEGITRN